MSRASKLRTTNLALRARIETLRLERDEAVAQTRAAVAALAAERKLPRFDKDTR